MSENTGKSLALQSVSILDQLPRPYAVAAVSKYIKVGLSALAVYLFATHAAPVLGGAMWAMTKLFASGTSMIITGVALVVTLKMLPKLMEVVERLFDGFAEIIVLSCIKASPVLWLQPAVDEVERGEEVFKQQQLNIEGVLGDYRSEAQKIRNENEAFRGGARSEANNPDSTRFDELAELISQNEAILVDLDAGITAMEDVLKQLGDVERVYHHEANILRREMKSAETSWRLSNMMNIAMSAAETVLYESASSSPRKRAKQAAGIINERRASTFARLRNLTNKTAPIIIAYKAGNQKVADQLRLSLQREKDDLLLDISQKETVNA